MQLGRERGLNMTEALPKPIRVEHLQERLAGFKQVSKPLLAADLAAALAADQLFLESAEARLPHRVDYRR
jgi:hypothetical protein